MTDKTFRGWHHTTQRHRSIAVPQRLTLAAYLNDRKGDGDAGNVDQVGGELVLQCVQATLETHTTCWQSNFNKSPITKHKTKPETGLWRGRKGNTNNHPHHTRQKGRVRAQLDNVLHLPNSACNYDCIICSKKRIRANALTHRQNFFFLEPWSSCDLANGLRS